MNRFFSVAAIALVMTVGLAACGSTATGGPASQAPAASAPTATATPRASTPAPSRAPLVSPEPSARPTVGPLHVDLANATGHDLSIDIQDESGRVVKASSGTPGDGASVAWRELRAENIDARTLRLTWTGMPGDDHLGLYVDEAAKVILVLQSERDGDAIAFDRVLVVEFDRPISANALTLGVQEGLDTIG
jgi:hypothetical protein